jgi:ribosomal protein S27E
MLAKVPFLFFLCIMVTVIDTLRKAAARSMLLRVECQSCQRVVNFLARDIMAFADPNQPPQTVKFRCSECGAKGGKVTTIERDKDRDRGIIVWRPMRLK